MDAQNVVPERLSCDVVLLRHFESGVTVVTMAPFCTGSVGEPGTLVMSSANERAIALHEAHTALSQK